MFRELSNCSDKKPDVSLAQEMLEEIICTTNTAGVPPDLNMDKWYMFLLSFLLFESLIIIV